MISTCFWKFIHQLFEVLDKLINFYFLLLSLYSITEL